MISLPFLRAAWPAVSLMLLSPVCTVADAAEASPPMISGIYPHLAMFNQEPECGTGAVVPWADRLWVITYGPHSPFGSSDKLYEITPGLEQIVRPESVGGTHAARMIHRESNQLFIGPYAIDSARRVRVIAPLDMPGRLTGIARHLGDPARKLYYATMEEGLYEVDVHSLAVTPFIRDDNAPPAGVTVASQAGTVASALPGYHGKGLYSGQGRLIYANNGERSAAARVDPTSPSGALGEWRAPGEDWQLVRRNQFTDVTGPGGIFGNTQPATDPVWSIGWDAKSLLLMVLEDGKWHTFRLPKASHSYDGAHGWNTEWPRIRDIGEKDLLMTMHGMFWRFPRTLNATNSGGIAPRSTYLKVIGDFARWQDRIVFGCDDTAAAEFLNRRAMKPQIAAPQSQSNLWFLEPGQLDTLGPVLGRGLVWRQEDVPADQPSDPMLFAGFPRRAVHLSHEGDTAVTLRLEIDARGDGTWTSWREVKIAPSGYAWLDLTDAPAAPWVRVVSVQPLKGVTAAFHFGQPDARLETADARFAGLAAATTRAQIGGTVRAIRDDARRTLEFAARTVDETGARDRGLYELTAALELRRIDDAAQLAAHHKNTPLPTKEIQSDAASLLVTDDAGRRWRLPRGIAANAQAMALGTTRIVREVATERDLLNVGGTFYELPAENAGGFAKLRPVATHGRSIVDYASYRGLLVMTGIDLAATGAENNPHVIRSADGHAALWVGAIDDLWTFGKPRGHGGPWKQSAVEARVPSDPYLMTGYDAKRLTLSHDAVSPVEITVEVDLDGTGLWQPYRRFLVSPGEEVAHEFPAAFQSYWLRTVASAGCRATAQLEYR